MHKRCSRSLALLAAATVLTVATPFHVQAQSTVDQQQLRLAQIQADRRAVALKFMELDDPQVAAFVPIYDDYQMEYKRVLDRATALIDRFASHYASMPDDVAGRILRDWFRVKEDEDKLIEKYAGRLGNVLPPAKVLRFVQIENQLSTTLRLAALQRIPLVN